LEDADLILHGNLINGRAHYTLSSRLMLGSRPVDKHILPRAIKAAASVGGGTLPLGFVFGDRYWALDVCVKCSNQMLFDFKFTYCPIWTIS
jgi:hypothetical protein